jgi:hypothetical protein
MPLSHCVFFKLRDSSPAKVDQLIGACNKYLSDHPGVVYYAAGKREPSLAREVNDKEHEVALIVVFDSMANHDAYQVAPLHLKFIEEQRANWQSVRVFDATI